MQRVKPLALELQLWVETAASAWLTAERGRFFLVLPAIMAAGVLAYFALPWEPPGWAACAVVLAAAAGAVAARHRLAVRAVCLAVAFATSGVAAAGLATWRAPSWDEVPRTATIASGRVAGIEALPQGRRMTLTGVSLDDGTILQRAVRVRLRDTDTAALSEGDSVQIRALLRLPSPPAYPGGWDMQRDAFFQGMGAYGFAIGPTQVVAASPGGALRGVRETIAGRIMAALPGERGAIAATLLTGLGTAIPQTDRAAFAASGLAHLLAVAGLHIGIVMGLLFGVVRWGLAASEYASLHWPTRRVAALAALTGGAGYMLLTGAHVPILRSFVMAAVVTLAVLTGRRAISLRALALAALALMAVAPWEVVGVSFQMSFASVLALVAAWEALRPYLAQFALGRWWRGPVLYGGGLALTSAVAGTASLPFAAYHFGNATLWYVPANMLAVPLTAFWVLPWGVAALLMMPFGAAGLALLPMGWGIGGLLALARGVAAWPGAVWPVPQLPPQALLLMSAGMVWLCIWRTRLRLAGLVFIAAGCALAFAVRAPDALVSADSRVVAARIGGRVFVELRGGASAFEAEAPGRVWGVAKVAAFPAEGEGDGAVVCDAQACRWMVGARRVMLARSGDASCRDMDVALSGLALRGCGADLVIDRRSVAQDGAVLLYGDDVVTDRELRGDRPWVIRGAPSLPPAKTE